MDALCCPLWLRATQLASKMGLHKGRRHALLHVLASLASLLLFRGRGTPIAPSAASSASIYTSAAVVAPSPTAVMVGRAVLAVPLVMSGASSIAGSRDVAKAAPMASMNFAEAGVSPSPGCSMNNRVTVDTTLNVTLGTRRYLLYFPANYQPDKPAPLVLSYHGGRRTAEEQQALDLLSTTYFNEDYIVVYPNANDARLLTGGLCSWRRTQANTRHSSHGKARPM